MAENIKALHLSQLPSVVAKDLTVLKRENLFPRTFYEFDLTTRTAEKSIQEGVDIEEVDTIEEVDSIPLTIMKSKKVHLFSPYQKYIWSKLNGYFTYIQRKQSVWKNMLTMCLMPPF